MLLLKQGLITRSLDPGDRRWWTAWAGRTCPMDEQGLVGADIRWCMSDMPDPSRLAWGGSRRRPEFSGVPGLRAAAMQRVGASRRSGPWEAIAAAGARRTPGRAAGSACAQDGVLHV